MYNRVRYRVSEIGGDVEETGVNINKVIKASGAIIYVVDGISDTPEKMIDLERAARIAKKNIPIFVIGNKMETTDVAPLRDFIKPYVGSAQVECLAICTPRDERLTTCLDWIERVLL